MADVSRAIRGSNPAWRKRSTIGIQEEYVRGDSLVTLFTISENPTMGKMSSLKES